MWRRRRQKRKRDEPSRVFIQVIAASFTFPFTSYWRRESRSLGAPILIGSSASGGIVVTQGSTKNLKRGRVVTNSKFTELKEHSVNLLMVNRPGVSQGIHRTVDSIHNKRVKGTLVVILGRDPIHES